MAPRLMAVLLLVLTSACTTSHAVRIEMGQGELREYWPPTVSRSVKAQAGDFEEALAQLVLEAPLTLRPVRQAWLVRASYPSSDADTRWKHLMRKSFGGFCKAGQRREDCLSLLDDAMGLSQWDKLGVALGLSLDPLRESISRAVENTLAPQLFYTVIATGLITWAVLAANPEPVFTKAAAIVSMVMLICLGVETFLEVVSASRELKQATDRATTLEELEQSAARFANRVGPEVARVFVLAVTVALSHGMTGGAALLATRLSMLPGFSEAAAMWGARLGVNLADVGQVSAVAVVEGNLVVSVAPTAVAMAVGQGVSGGSAAVGSTSSGFRSWGSFSGLKDALGAAGAGKQWHHIVEQTEGNVQRFGPHAIHNTDNVMAIDEGVHRQISGLYSSKRPYSQGMTVRQWLSTKSFEEQRAFGLKTLRDFGVVP